MLIMKKISFSFKGRVVGSLASLLLTAGLAFGQSDTARVEGTVTDSVGAAIAGATVSVINTETNSRLETTTNEQGNYVAPLLKVGTYRVEVSAEGFRKNIQTNITLTVSQIAQINTQLDTGEISDVVEVTSSAPLVETSSAALGQVIEGKQIVDLPINGRNFTQFATLVPGVSRGTPGSTSELIAREVNLNQTGSHLRGVAITQPPVRNDNFP
jgi:hypothetical protein